MEAKPAKEASVEIPDKVLYTLIAVVVLVTLSVRAQSRITTTLRSEEPAPMESIAAPRRSPPQASPIVYYQRIDDSEPTEFSARPSTAESLIPHTTIGQTEPHVIVAKPEEDPADEYMTEEEFVQILEDEFYSSLEDEYVSALEDEVIDPNVNVWGTSDQETFDQIVGIMNESEAASFRALWLSATPEERRELLLRARLGMLGG